MGFLLWFTRGGGGGRRRGGTDVFVCLVFKNSLPGGGERGFFDGCCCRSLSRMPERLNWDHDKGASQ